MYKKVILEKLNFDSKDIAELEENSKRLGR